MNNKIKYRKNNIAYYQTLVKFFSKEEPSEFVNGVLEAAKTKLAINKAALKALTGQ